jgi:hypothetical protein
VPGCCYVLAAHTTADMHTGFTTCSNTNMACAGSTQSVQPVPYCIVCSVTWAKPPPSTGPSSGPISCW